MTPPTNLGYTATPANANLDTLPQLSALLAAMLPQGGRTVPSLAQFLANNAVLNALDFGIKGDGVTDDAPAIAQLQTAMPASKCLLYFPATPTGYKVSAFPIVRRGVRIVGERDGRPSQGGGTRFLFAPVSQVNPVSCIQLGTSGLANDPFFDASYANANYSGPQELYIENVSFAYAGATTTPLTNGVDTYGTNTVAIRDFFAGDVRLRNVWFEHFHYGFWGVQSDFDQFDNVYALYCKVGAYFGPRSDQSCTRNFQAEFCDTGLWRDRCHGGTDIRPTFVGCGAAATDTALRYGSQYADDDSSGHLCLNPWFEQQQGATVDAWIEFGGLADAQPARDITIVRPQLATNVQGVNPHAAYLARFGNGTRIIVDGLGNGVTNLLKTFKFTSASVNAQVMVRCHDDLFPTYDNTGAGTPTVAVQSFGAGQTIGGSNGRVFLRRTDQPANYANDVFISSESSRAFYAQAYNLDNTGGAAEILAITRNLQFGAAAPTTGTWRQGDTVINQAPSAGAPTAWVCAVAGTPGTWTPIDVVPSTSADRGDAAVALSAGTDAPTQKFNTPLTAPRLVTLNAAGAWNGAKFRVVRTANATGASALTVAGKALAVGQWVDVEYDGAAWNEVAFGSL